MLPATVSPIPARIIPNHLADGTLRDLNWTVYHAPVGGNGEASQDA
jgi:hypothetical protein